MLKDIKLSQLATLDLMKFAIASRIIIDFNL
jgi:hypothetical protein